MPQALDIATKLDAGTDFHSFLNSVNDSEEVLGYVQINGSEWDSRSAVDELAAFISKNAEPYVRRGTYYGHRHDVIAARFRNTIGRFLLTMIECGKPTIAGIQGRISGEYLGLMLAFDTRIATSDTTVSFDNIRTGLPASPGLTYLMPRYIGAGLAMSLIQRGEIIGAEEALSLGLVSTIVDSSEELTNRCLEQIKTMAENHRHLIKYHRQHILPSADEIKASLEDYYDAMSKSIVKLRH